jgi:putative MATE family efflux protein
VNNKKDNNFLGELPLGKLLFKMSLPTTIGMLVSILYNVVDSIFIGHYIGSLGIAAITIIFPLSMIIMGISSTLGIGAASIISMKLGEKNIEYANKVFGNFISLIFIISFLSCIFSYIFIEPILKFLGSTNEILPFAKDYLSIIIFGAFFQIFSTSTNIIIRGEGFVKIPMISMIIGTVSNIILDYLFIVIFNLGISGSAFATVISQFLSFLFTFSYFLFKKSILEFKFINLKLNINIIKNILITGIPSFIRTLSMSIVGLIMNNSIKYYGNDITLASYGLLFQLMMIIILPALGILQGTQPIIGYNYGAKKNQRVKKILILSIKVSTLIITIIYFFVIIYPEILIKLFTNDLNLIENTKHISRIMLLAIPLIGFQFIASGFFQSIGKAKPAIITSLLRQFILLIPLILILPFFFGLDGLWYSYPIADLTSFFITFYLFKKEYDKL